MGDATTVDVLPLVASEGQRLWQVRASWVMGRSCGVAISDSSWRYLTWSWGLKVAMLPSLTERFRRALARRLQTAALPSAMSNCASGVEQPSASTMGKELLLCRWR